jgi:hypothetical protein
MTPTVDSEWVERGKKELISKTRTTTGSYSGMYGDSILLQDIVPTSRLKWIYLSVERFSSAFASHF